MYESIKRLYESGRLSVVGVNAAVDRGWITPEQARELIEGEHDGE